MIACSMVEVAGRSRGTYHAALAAPRRLLALRPASLTRTAPPGRPSRRPPSDRLGMMACSSATSSNASAASEKTERRRAAILAQVEVVDAATVPTSWNNKVVLVDKPLDWTSFDVCGKLRNLVKLKAGHAGTLDPQATGLLIVCLGRATKTVDHFQGQGKAYEGTLRLGEETQSYDHCTPVDRQAAWSHLTDADLESAALSFVGNILQVPPMYSAIKKKGKKLYELARKGITVEREPRPVTVEEFRVWRPASSPDSQSVHFSVKCSKGTYIRSLVHDFGRSLESAAHMTSLRRTQIGHHSVQGAWKLHDLIALLERERDAAGGGS